MFECNANIHDSCSDCKPEATSALYAAHHTSRFTKGTSVRGILSDLKMTVQKTHNRRIMISANAAYHGKDTTLRLQTPDVERWKFRHTELARAMLKEVVYELHAFLNRQHGVPTTISRTWRDELSQEHPTEIVLDLKNDIIGACVKEIEWGRGFRWGGDAGYDPMVDGEIRVEASCVMADRTPTRPVWEPPSSTTTLSTTFHDLDFLKESVAAHSDSVVFGRLKHTSDEDECHPWSIASFECSRVMLNVPVV